MNKNSSLKYIAFYLTQFYPTNENNLWWGKGFTEWTNVTKALPLFPDHYQPHLPTELGFYDLRLQEVRHEQIELARSYGIDAFCFHYYWFGGKRLLEKPLFDFLHDKESNIEFCLCWANVNWTRKWENQEHHILIEQHYSPKNDLSFIDDILPFFNDSRYLRVNNAPVLIVYCPQYIPNPRETVARWREYCHKIGIGQIHLIAALTHGNIDYKQFDFDAGVEFPPHNYHLSTLTNHATTINSPHSLSGVVYNYNEFVEFYSKWDYKDSIVYRSVFPSWDNTSRAGMRAIIMLDSTPANYEKWIMQASKKTLAERAIGERLVFINAWNEWAEGCHLEPDRKFGRAFLEATLRVKNLLT